MTNHYNEYHYGKNIYTKSVYDCEERKKPVRHSANQQTHLGIYFAFVGVLSVLAVAASIGTVKLLNQEPKTLLANRTFAEMDKMQNIIDNAQTGVGGAYLPESRTTPYTTLDYYIKRGDSIHSLSRRFGIDECTIIKINNIDIPSKIVRGQKLLIPNQNGIQENVTRANSLDKIAQKYNMDKSELMRINNLVSEANVDKVFIPGMHYDGVSKKLLLGEYFVRPSKGRFTSMFGYRSDPFTKCKSSHTGVDIANRMGTKVHTAAPGKVVFAGQGRDYGNFIIVEHTQGYTTYYAHLSKILVKKGDWVSTKDTIGLVGSTGRSTGPHLHYEVRRFGKPINPMTVTVF